MMIYKNLHVSPHYSVNYTELLDICTTLSSSKIAMVVLGTDDNNFHPKIHEVMLMNNFSDDQQCFNYFEYKETKAWISKVKEVDKKCM